MKTFFISLWDSHDVESCFPGYFRQSATFGYEDGVLSNMYGVSWPVSGDCLQSIRYVKMHDLAYGPDLFSIALDSPVQHLHRGDTVKFASRGIRVVMDAGMYRVLTREASAVFGTLEQFLADHPDATMQQVWDTAFVAGHQTAYTMLTGETQ